MSHCHYHSISSVRKWGGEVGDYLPLHQWFDKSKEIIADPRHRALRHHAEGIFMLESIFGTVIVNSDGREVPVRLIGEQHVMEDLVRYLWLELQITSPKYELVSSPEMAINREPIRLFREPS